jgi:5-methylcytosine-specific restriction endonuclease McrA
MNEKPLLEIWNKTSGHCHFCGDPVDFIKRGWLEGDVSGYWEVDHVIQHRKGGQNIFANYLPACTRCNRLRWHRTGEKVRELIFLGLIAKK